MGANLILLSFVSFSLWAADYGPATVQQWQADADLGNPNAQYNLGLAYATGQGVPQDFSKAADYYTKAAGQGNVNAEYNLGILFMNGQGVFKDWQAASQWFEKAAAQGDINAAHLLADLLYDHKDFDGARKWYEKAAAAGVADAEFGLGLMYDLGQGVPQDYARALELYRQAAEQGSAAADCNIAVLYYNGEGVKPDRLTAHTFLLVADRLGEPRAKDLMSFTADKLTKKQIEEASRRADEWLQQHPARHEPAPVPMTVPASLNASM